MREKEEKRRTEDKKRGEEQREKEEEEEDAGNSVAERYNSRKSAVCSVLCSDFVVGRTLYNPADFTFNTLLL